MQNISLNPQGVKPTLFAPCKTNWTAVIHPPGKSIFAKVAKAVIELFKNLAKSFYNAVVWTPNKVFSLFHRNPVTTPTQTNPSSDTTEMDPLINMDNSLPEPTEAEAGSSFLLPTLGITLGTGALVATAIGINRYFGNKLGFIKSADDFIVGTAQSLANLVGTKTGLFSCKDPGAFCHIQPVAGK